VTVNAGADAITAAATTAKPRTGDHDSPSHEPAGLDVERARGDRTLFESDAIPYMRQMYPVALRLTHDRQEAEDLIQETFARAFVKFHQFTPGTNLRAWLHRIMFHTFYSACRKRGRRPAELLASDTCQADGLDAVVPSARSAEFQALENLGSSDVMRALAALPDRFKTVIYLVDVEGYRCAEVASMLEIPLGTVMSRLHRGRRALRTGLLEGAKRLPERRQGARRQRARQQGARRQGAARRQEAGRTPAAGPRNAATLEVAEVAEVAEVGELAPAAPMTPVAA
jgi:RNA polymerase sigma-70 factor, ECF subfamily